MVIQTVFFLFILALLELLFVPVPLAFLLLLLWSQFAHEEEALILAFMLGFLFDIALLRPFGTTSTLFMALLFVALLYKRKFQTTNAFFLTLLTFVSVLVIEYTYQRTVMVFFGLIVSIITVVVARVLFPEKLRYESWYRVS